MYKAECKKESLNRGMIKKNDVFFEQEGILTFLSTQNTSTNLTMSVLCDL